MRQHAGAGLVAAAVVAASLPEGMFEPTAYAAGSVVIWAAVVAGLAGRALPVAPVGGTAAAAGLCLAGTAALAVASVAWASDQGRAFEEAVRVSFYLGLFALAACTANRAGRSRWLTGLTVGLGVVSALALLAYLQPGLLDSGRSDVPNAAGRLSYPIGYWNGAAALLALAALLLLRAGVTAPTRGLRSAAVAVVPAAALGIWLASSRGGAVALAIGCAVLVATSPDRMRQAVVLAVAAAGALILIAAAHGMDALTTGALDAAQRSDGDWMSILVVGVALATAGVARTFDGARLALAGGRRLRIALATVAAFTAVVAIAAANPAEKFREFKEPPPTGGAAASGPDVSSNGRWQFWGAAVDAFESDPIAGVGAGGYEDWWGQHPKAALFVRNPHSLPLQQAAELGLPGLALFIGFAAALVLAGYRRLAQGRTGDAGILTAVIAAGVTSAVFDWTWEIPAVFGPVVVCAALLSASAPPRRRSEDPYWLGVGAVAAAWLAMVAGCLVVLGEIDLRKSRDAAAEARYVDGIESAERAHTVLPWSAEPYTQIALLSEERGRLDEALDYLHRAEERDSKDWRLALIEARLQARRGNRSAATRALNRAVSLSPLPISRLYLEDQG